MYNVEEVYTTINIAAQHKSSRHKKELDEDLAYNYGGFSGLYYLIPEEAALELDSYYEITKVEDGKWDFIKKNKDRSK